MKSSSAWQPLVAAAVVFLLLAGSYETAVRWPAARLAGTRVPTHFPAVIVTDSFDIVADSASMAAAGLTVPPPPRFPAPPVVVPPPAPAVLPTAAQLGYHRYEGTIDGRPVLAELNLSLRASNEEGHHLYPYLTGFFYDRKTGVSGTLGEASEFRPDQWLETDYHFPGGHPLQGRQVTILCADQPPGGPLLTGWCAQPEQRRAVPVRLSERYTDGVRYEILRQESWVPAPSEDKPNVSSVSRSYIHLLGPDTLRPALARLQCPPPAARQRLGQALLKQIGEFDHDEETLDITLNEAGLLAYTVFRERESGPRYYIQNRYQRLYDLRAGRELRLTDQLRPGGRQQLQRLLTRRALADTTYARHRDHWRHGNLLALPNEGFELTPTGWTAHYGEPDPEGRYGYARNLSWDDVRSLLRPTSPLQRLLRVRGL